ncbi:MAG: ATP-dependent RNA helicase [Rubripirellula sp.]
MNQQESFPVLECIESLIDALSQNRPVVLKAPPGAGKTTMVPPAILDSGLISDQQILVVQPRRLAATATASRIASMRNVRLGDEIGYHVRFDKKASNRTKLLTLTTGLLQRKLLTDPLLESVGCVVLDEFHERSIEMDLVLGMIEQIRRTFRPELKLVVMSATLDAGPISEFLQDAVSLHSEGRSYPVEIRYDTQKQQASIEQQVVQSLQLLLHETKGDVLIFLPGVGEIRRLQRHLQEHQLGEVSWQGIEFTELYGSMPTQRQSLALEPSANRKVILSTNIAETSVTIPGVESVIDTGVARILDHDTSTGLPRLTIQPISQASTDQRAGRAGRTGPGKCHRLWPIALQRSRRANDQPEILRGDLAGVMLTLAGWGEKDFDAFPWLTKPPMKAVDQARELLKRLGAVDQTGNITELGKEMVQLPLSPRLARLMIEARDRDVVEQASIAAALLSEKDPFDGEKLPPSFIDAYCTDSMSGSKSSVGESRVNQVPRRAMIMCDLWPRIEAIQAFRDGDQNNKARSFSGKQILRVAGQLQREVENASPAAGSTAHLDVPNHNPPREQEHPSIRLRRSLLAAFPDRLAKRREEPQDQRTLRRRIGTAIYSKTDRKQRGVLAAGKGVQLNANTHVIDSELFLCLEMQAGASEASVKLACGIDPDWFTADDFQERDIYLFDKEKAAVLARRQRRLHDLPIHEIPITCEASPEVAKILFDAAKENPSLASPPDNSPLWYLANRISLVHQHFPNLGLSEVTPETYSEILAELCNHHTTLSALQNAPWHQQLRTRYDYASLMEVDRLAPAEIQIPSGRKVEIHYDRGKPPRIFVRIQEIFGWTKTPRILENRVPFLLHLLGPNGREQQITDDLENFWASTYQQIRKELKRRYSKHAWPEDPLTATATRNGLQRKT